MRQLLALLLLLAPAAALGEQAVRHGDYVVHYAALPSTDLVPEVARALGLTRSRHRAVLVINAQRREDGRMVPVPATGTGRARNLMGHQQDLALRAVHDRGAHYLLAEFEALNQEWLSFEAVVLPQGATAPLEIRFRQQFYTD